MSFNNLGRRVQRAGGLAFINSPRLGRRVINKTGTAIAIDKLVAMVGFDVTSGLPKVVLADADVATHTDLYVTTEAIADGAEAHVYKGVMSTPNLNTNSATAAGDPVFMSSSAGAFAHAAPTASGSLVAAVGFVVVKSATVGQIYWDTGLGLRGAGGVNFGSVTGYINLNILTVRIISGNVFQNTTEAGVPDGNTAPSIQRVNAATDKQGRLIWAAAGVEEIQFAPFAYPPDLDDAQAVTVNILAAMAGATDTPTVAVAYFEGVGDTNAGGNTGAVTGASVAKYSVTIAAGDVGVYPKSASISLIPAAHGTDALHLYAAWIEYTRKL